MATTITPNMNLIVPGVTTEPGPDYATDINTDLGTVDSHDHSSGKGVQITPDGLNINKSLTLAGNFLTTAAGVKFQAQTTTPSTGTIYQNAADLYFIDGNGNNVRITQSGGIAGSPGTISNLTSPASAAYVSASNAFVWESDTNIAANMDFGSAVMRNISPNSTFALTLQPPVNLGSNYTLTLPTVPAQPSFLSIDASGAIAPYTPLANGLSGANISNGSITNTQIAANTITNGQIAAGTIRDAEVSSSANIALSKLAPVSSSTATITSYSNNTATFTTVAQVAVTGAAQGRILVVSFDLLQGILTTNSSVTLTTTVNNAPFGSARLIIQRSGGPFSIVNIPFANNAIAGGSSLAYSPSLLNHMHLISASDINAGNVTVALQANVTSTSTSISMLNFTMNAWMM